MKNISKEEAIGLIMFVAFLVFLLFNGCSTPKKTSTFTHVIYQDSTDGEKGTAVTDTLHK